LFSSCLIQIHTHTCHGCHHSFLATSNVLSVQQTTAQKQFLGWLNIRVMFVKLDQLPVKQQNLSSTILYKNLIRWIFLQEVEALKCSHFVTCLWFSPGTPVSSTNKTDCHNITEILLKVALNTINQTKPLLISDINRTFGFVYLIYMYIMYLLTFLFHFGL